jgi:hypothetical protein
MTNDELYHALVVELRRNEDLRRELEESWQSRRVMPHDGVTDYPESE